MTRRTLTRCTLALLLALQARSARAETFSDILDTPITRPIGHALAQSIARSLPVAAASSGVSFVFDPETAAFERETVILGQLFLERAAPLGKGKWNVTANYQWVRIDSVDGEVLGALTDTDFPIVDPDTGAQFTIPLFGLDLVTHQFTFGATYGLTDDLDVNLTIPVLYSHFEVNVAFRDIASGRLQTDRVDSSVLGAGDLFLRSKYRFFSGELAEAAAGLILRLPSGNEDNFQGTGAMELAPLLYLSTQPFPLGSRFKTQAHVNGGIDFNAEDVNLSEGRLGVGLDLGMPDRFTVAIAMLSRYPFTGVAPPGAFDVDRVDPATGSMFRAPLLGLERNRENIFDLSFGGRVNLWRDTVFGLVNVILPLNDAGFRSEVVPLVGLEAAF